MPRNGFSMFLQWSRAYIAKYGDARFRRTWRAICERYPYAPTRRSVISTCEDCSAPMVTGGDTFMQSVTRAYGVAIALYYGFALR